MNLLTKPLHLAGLSLLFLVACGSKPPVNPDDAGVNPTEDLTGVVQDLAGLDLTGVVQDFTGPVMEDLTKPPDFFGQVFADLTGLNTVTVNWRMEDCYDFMAMQCGFSATCGSFN